jgi:GNAT superfamily N-acetyltransferase
MQVRKMKVTELQAVKSLIDSNFQKGIKVEVLNDGCTYVGIQWNGEIVTACRIVDGNRLAWLCSKYKRLGHAKWMMEVLLSRFPDMYLKVKKYNTPAINLYESMGFVITESSESSYTMKKEK